MGGYSCLLFCTRLPFDAPSHNGLAVKIAEGKYRDIPSTYTAELQSLIRALLQLQVMHVRMNVVSELLLFFFLLIR